MLPKLHRWQLLWNILTEIAETGLILGSLFGVGNDIVRIETTVVKVEICWIWEFIWATE